MGVTKDLDGFAECEGRQYGRDCMPALSGVTTSCNCTTKRPRRSPLRDVEPQGVVPTENRFPMGLDALSVSDSGITLSPGPGIWKGGTNMADSRVFDGSPVIPVLYSLIFRY